MSSQPHLHTKLAQSGIADANAYGAITPPLHLSSTFAWPSPEQKPAFDYSRTSNPTRATLEQTLCELEGATKCTITSSGMSAVHLVLSLLSIGETIVAPHDCYGGTHRLLTCGAKKGHFKVEFIDQTDTGALADALQRKPKLLLLETPSNPLLRIVDIEQSVLLAKQAGTLVVADNTFMSPVLQQPLLLGCDMVLHSTTKFINGHSDVVGGAVLTHHKELGEELAYWANAIGITGSPFDSFLTLRGVRTLFTRIRQQQETTARFIDEISNWPQIKQIWYPGLSDHPGHEIARRQQKGFGSLLSIEFNDDVDVSLLLQNVYLFKMAVSLGGYESLVCLPAIMTHGAVPREELAAAGISERLVRFSIGLEHPTDLVEDLRQALGQ